MKNFITIIAIMGILCACSNEQKETQNQEDFNYVLERFGDLQVYRYQVPGFDDLSLNQKKLIYYLSEASNCGRDIFTDQNGKYNLAVRSTLENIYETYSGDRENENWGKFLVYLKRIWFSNGIYHHYANEKFDPGFPVEYFEELVANSSKDGWVTIEDKTPEESLAFLTELMFNPDIMPKKVSQDASKDIVKASAVNFYENVTKEEVDELYRLQKKPDDATPISYGLNTKVVKENGLVLERVYKSGGMYGSAIDQIIHWLEKAEEVAETPEQKTGISQLIEYYKTGDLNTWDEYNITWVGDTAALIDFVNGFIEVYDDPLGMKATWESVVNFKDLEATKRTKIISENAQWFEDHSPIDERFKKEEVKGVTAKVITVATLGGACYPHTPIGINLPNADWIRATHGSKSVSLQNITHADEQASLKTGFLEEFAYNQEEVDLIRKYSSISDNLHTDLHECLGHGSGKMLPGVTSEALENYHSPLEETRADLFALYYMMDEKLIELGLIPSLDVAKAQYISYIRNGLMTQLRRIDLGKTIEQAHMRNRQLISKWCFEKGAADNVIELAEKDGKHYVVINDYQKLRELFGELLIEVQRIKSEGDYEAGKNLVETYGVQIDPDIHKEVIDRFAKLDIAAYRGFVNPVYETVEENGEIKDIKVKYVDDFAEQMMYYSKKYDYLPVIN